MRFTLTQVYSDSKPHVKAVLLWAVISIGMFLRIHHADIFPIYQNDDGLYYVWVGNSVLQNFKHPTSLTIFDTDNQNIFWRSQYRNIIPAEQFGYRLTDPWFDHPFLASILISLPAHYWGYQDFSQIPHMIVRTPAFVAAFMTLLFTYLLTNRLYSQKIALVSVAILALWPLAVFSSRHSYIENIMTPFWLISLILTWDYTHLKSNKKWQFPLILACNIFLSWSKIIGYVSFVITAYWMYQTNRKKQVLITIGVAIMSLALYAAYGTWIGGSYFWQTLLHQGDRGAYLTSIFHILLRPDVFGILEDGWWLICWFAVMWISKGSSESNRFISTNIIIWLAALFFLVGTQNNSPWYRYPMYPLLAIAASHLIHQWWQSGNFIVGSLLAMLGLTGYRLGGIEISATIIRFSLISYLGLLAMNQKRITRLLILAWAMAAILGNIIAIFKYPYLACADHNCATPTKIDITKPNL